MAVEASRWGVWVAEAVVVVVDWLMSMAQVCCDSAAAATAAAAQVVGAEAEARARARAERRRRAGEAAGRWRHAGAAAGGTPDAATRKRSLEAGELLVARKHGAASVAGRRREMEDAVSVREAFALAEGSHGGRRDFYGMHELLAEELAVAAADVSWTAAMRSSLSPPPTSPGPRRWSAASRGWSARGDAAWERGCGVGG